MSTYREILRLPSEPDPEQLLLVDGHSLAYRSYYAIRDLSTKAGEPVNAVFGFWRAMLATLREHPSAYVAVAFDAGGATFRHEMYGGYKATRKPIPEDLASQLPRIEQLLAALGIRTFCEPGVEADDVMASLARNAAASGLSCLILTSDKDMAQLVDARISILRPSGRGSDGRAEILDPEGVRAKYGVTPEQIVDWLSLVGDSSDNVPGVPGVGEKTAARLLDEFGSLDRLLAETGSLRNGRIAENLETNARGARLARELIELKADLPLGNVREVCRLRGVDVVALASFFASVEFGSALLETGLDAPAGPSPAVPAGDMPQYRAILDETALDAVLEEMREAGGFALDLETTSLDPMDARIVGIALSAAPFVGYYIPVAHDVLGAPEQLPLDRVLERLRPLIEGERPLLYGQNLKYDISVLANYGIRPRGIAFDSMIASHLVRPDERRHNLGEIAASFLGCRVTSYEEVAGKDGSFASVPIDAATQYAAEDAEIVQRLHAPLAHALDASGTRKLFDEVEVPLVPVLARMERAGILVDPRVLAQQGEELRAELEIVERDLWEMAGGPFNPSSSKQVAEILFERLGLPVIERTKTGPSTSARVLSELAVHHALPGRLMAHRELKKLLTTYIDQLPKSIRPETGRIHTSFHQTATATGRLSSSDPNLQNIPTRTELGGRIRHAFVAPEGSLLLSADYSQVELRLLAHMSEPGPLRRAFAEGADLHRRTASHIFGVPESAVTDRQRSIAKRINFGILYGISPYGLARDLGVSQSEGKAFIDRFFDAYPQAKETIDRLIALAAKRGYAETILGRRRPLPDIVSRNVARRNFDRRNAVNTPIQGSAADLIKLAMLHIDEAIEAGRVRARMLLQIHDELLFEVPGNDREQAASSIAESMAGVMPLDVPLEVKTAVGNHWGEV